MIKLNTVELFKDLKDNYYITTCGRVYNSSTNKLMKNSISKKTGYVQISLTKKDNKLVTYLIHRLVLISFNGFKPLHVNHIDGNKLNNSLYNLEWVTMSQNMRHAYSKGLLVDQVGENNAFSKITNKQASDICILIERYYNNSEISKKLNISIDIIRTIREKRAWVVISQYFKMYMVKSLSIEDIDFPTIDLVKFLLDNEFDKYTISEKLDIGVRAIEVIKSNYC